MGSGEQEQNTSQVCTSLCDKGFGFLVQREKGSYLGTRALMEQWILKQRLGHAGRGVMLNMHDTQKENVHDLQMCSEWRFLPFLEYQTEGRERFAAMLL